MEYKLSYINKATEKRVTKFFNATSDKAAIKIVEKELKNIKGQFEDPWLTDAIEEQLVMDI